MEKSEALSAVYQDIIDIEINYEDSLKTMMEKFYEVMRKHGIKQGKKHETGVSVCTAEWNMCFMVFKQHKMLAFDLWLSLNEPPKDLKY